MRCGGKSKALQSANPLRSLRAQFLFWRQTSRRRYLSSFPIVTSSIQIELHEEGGGGAGEGGGEAGGSGVGLAEGSNSVGGKGHLATQAKESASVARIGGMAQREGSGTDGEGRCGSARAH